MTGISRIGNIAGSEPIVSSRKWCATFNNYTPEEYKYLVNEAEKFQYIIVGKETAPTTGTPHLQIYIEPGEKVGKKRIQQIISGSTRRRQYERVSVTIANGDAPHNLVYISKQDAHPLVVGIPGESGKSSQLGLCIADIKKYQGIRDSVHMHSSVWVTHHRGLTFLKKFYQRNIQATRSFICITGPSNIGKTSWINFHYPNAYWLPNAHGNSGSESVFWDEYIDQETIVIDDFMKGIIPFSLLLRVADKFAVTVQTKGSCIQLQHKTLIISSNYNVSDWFPGVAYKEPMYRRITKYVNQLDVSVWRTANPNPSEA